MSTTTAKRLHDQRPLFDPGDPAMVNDPYPLYRRLRETAPVHRTPAGYWVFSRYADVDALLRDPRLGKGFHRLASSPMATARGGAGSPLVEEMSRWMLFQDPPDHTRLRGLVTKAFTPRAVERIRSRVQEIVDELIDRVAGTGEMDAIADFAFPLPVTVIAEMLGLPAAEAGRCRAWTVTAGRVLDPNQTPEQLAQAIEAIGHLSDHIRQHVAERRRTPGDDLLSVLIAAEEDGERLTEDELVSTANLLFGAGHETTVNLIGNGLLALLRHPDQLAMLAGEPALVPNAVEELLRYDSPAQLIRRWAREDLELGGVQLAAGDELLLVVGAANRDPERFGDPDVADVGRTDVRHVSFGGGPHHCLGAMLARMEAQVAFATLLRRLPDIRLATDVVQWREQVVLRGLKVLPVRFGA
jgi:cytochrome P450